MTPGHKQSNPEVPTGWWLCEDCGWYGPWASSVRGAGWLVVECPECGSTDVASTYPETS